MTPAPLAALIRQACRLEVTARKPGNVHPAARFPDLSYADFLAAADAASPRLAEAAALGVGPAVEAAVRDTRRVVSSNVNLGIALLLAPLAAVPRSMELSAGIDNVLSRLTVADAEAVYRAIRLAAPGGLGTQPRQDVAIEPTDTLLTVMQMAADRDRVARQYACGFADVLDCGRQSLRAWHERTECDWEVSVIGLHLSLLAEFPDSLIARKCGPEVAAEASARARQVLALGWPEGTGARACADLDRWLRADGHRRNPGTTADLVAATLFAVLRDGQLSLPDV